MGAIGDLGAFGFWMFIAAVVVGGMWFDARKREKPLLGPLDVWWPGAEWNAGFANSHGVRLSALRASAELPTGGFSVFSYVCLLGSRLIYMR